LRLVRRLPVEFACRLTGLPLGAGILQPLTEHDIQLYTKNGPEGPPKGCIVKLLSSVWIFRSVPAGRSRTARRQRGWERRQHSALLFKCVFYDANNCHQYTTTNTTASNTSYNTSDIHTACACCNT